jgi:hypothetical protein
MGEVPQFSPPTRRAWPRSSGLSREGTATMKHPATAQQGRAYCTPAATGSQQPPLRILFPSGNRFGATKRAPVEPGFKGVAG